MNFSFVSTEEVYSWPIIMQLSPNVYSLRVRDDKKGRGVFSVGTKPICTETRDTVSRIYLQRLVQLLYDAYKENAKTILTFSSGKYFSLLLKYSFVNAACFLFIQNQDFFCSIFLQNWKLFI